MNNTKTILLVEDNENDVFFMKRALQSAEITNPLQVVMDGQAAVDYLAGNGPYADRNQYPLPILIFLDLKLPHKPGLEVLYWLRQQREFKKIVALVLSTSREPRDIERACEIGANAFLTKPSSVSQLTEMMKSVKFFWLTFHQFV